MCIITLIGYLEFEAVPQKYYAILIQSEKEIDSIPLTLGDTTWTLFRHFSFYYTIFHTENLTESKIVRIHVEREDIAGLMIIEADTIISVSAPATVEYSMKLFTPMGVLIFPETSAYLDSIQIAMEGRQDTLRPPILDKYGITTILFLSGTRNVMSIYGKGNFKILWGRVLPIP